MLPFRIERLRPSKELFLEERLLLLLVCVLSIHFFRLSPEEAQFLGQQSTENSNQHNDDGYHPALIFDWYAAPIAQHHSLRELAEWCNELGLTVTATHGGMQYWNKLHRLFHLICGGNTIRGLPVGVKAEKRHARPV